MYESGVAHFALCLWSLSLGSDLPFTGAFHSAAGRWTAPPWDTPNFQFRESAHSHRSWTGTTVLGASRRDALRTMLETTTPAALLLPTMRVTFAADFPPPTQPPLGETVVLRGRVTVPSDVNLELSLNNSPALYITCRPDKPDDVPAAILNGSRGKSPPVLSTRLSNPTFPLDFDLVLPRDLTLEGAWDGKPPLPSGETPLQIPSSLDELWWNQADLIVSARWDNDGVASTRSPDDLVGRGLWKSSKESGNKENSIVEIQLTGRGAFGRFATGGSSKK